MAGVVGWHTETHTNLGSPFNWCLECLGDRATHSTEREEAKIVSQVISGTHLKQCPEKFLELNAHMRSEERPKVRITRKKATHLTKS